MEASRTPESDELLRLAIDSFLEDVHTCMPGKVESYDADKQKADVKPMLKRLIQHEDGQETVESLPVIPDVPVIFQRGGGFFQSFPLKKGDLVALHFAERSIDSYLSSSGADSDPGVFTRHDLTDAVAVPGLYPFNRAIKDISSANMVMGDDNGGIQIHLTPDGTMEVKLEGDSSDAVALGNVLKLFWDSIFVPVFNAHIHPTALGPSGTSAVPAPPFDPNIISKVLLVKGP